MPRQLNNLRVQIRKEYENIISELLPTASNSLFVNALKGFGTTCIKGIGADIPGTLEKVELSIIDETPVIQYDIDVIRAAKESFNNICNSLDGPSVINAAGINVQTSVKKISELLNTYEEVEKYYLQVQNEFPDESMSETDKKVDSFFDSTNRIQYDGSPVNYDEALYTVKNSYDEAIQNASYPDFPDMDELEKSGQNYGDESDLPSEDEVENAGQNYDDLKMDYPNMGQINDIIKENRVTDPRKKPREEIKNNLEKDRLMINDEFSKLISVLTNKAEGPDEENALQFFSDFIKNNISGYNDSNGNHVDGLFEHITKELEINHFPSSDDINACKKVINEFNSHCFTGKNEVNLLGKAGYNARFISSYISELLDGFVNLANRYNEQKTYYSDSDSHTIENIMGLDNEVANVTKEYHLNEYNPVKFIQAQVHFVDERMQGTSLITSIHELTRYFNNMYDTAPERLKDGLAELGNALNNFSGPFDDIVFNKEAFRKEDFDLLNDRLSMVFYTKAKLPNLYDFSKMYVFDTLFQKISDDFKNYKNYITEQNPSINLREYACNEKDYVIHCSFDEIFKQDARIFEKFNAYEKKKIKAENEQIKVDSAEVNTGTSNLNDANLNSTIKKGNAFDEWSHNTYDSLTNLMTDFKQYPQAMKNSNKGFTKQSEEFKQFTLRAEKLVERYNQLGEALNNGVDQKKAWEQFIKQLLNVKIDAQNYKDHCDRIPHKNSSVRQQRESLTTTLEICLDNMLNAIDTNSPGYNFKDRFNKKFEEHINMKTDYKLKNIPKAKLKEIDLDSQNKTTEPPAVKL